MAKKVIIHIAFKHRSNDTRIFRKQCISLAKKANYDVTYITSDINSSVDEGGEENNVKKIIIPAYPKRIIRQFVHLSRVKKLLKSYEHIDVVELHEPALLLIALWLKRRGIKVIFDSHEDYFLQLKMAYGSMIAHMYKWYEKHVCKQIDGVIFPCRMLNKEVFDYKVKQYAYVDNYPILKNEDMEFVEKKEFLACYTGTITYERGVINDIKAWNKAHIKGVLAGWFNSSDLEKEIRSMKEFKCVEYRGYCDSEELDKLYKEVSIGMCTLLDRGQYHKTCNLPTKACEYMMYGIPTIIYKTPYVESVMKEYEFGIMVDPENVDEIANAISLLKSDPNLRQKMGEAGEKAVREKFNWGVEEKKLYALYDDIINDT